MRICNFVDLHVYYIFTALSCEYVINMHANHVHYMQINKIADLHVYYSIKLSLEFEQMASGLVYLGKHLPAAELLKAGDTDTARSILDQYLPWYDLYQVWKGC